MTLYFAEGLPFSLVHQVSTQVLVAEGATPIVVGLTSFYGLAWNFKFLIGPLVDKKATLKQWVLPLEVGLAITVLGLALAAGAESLAAILMLFALVALLGATHDVAVDGLYIAALDVKAQAALSGVRVALYRVAMLFAGGGLVILAGLRSFRLSFAVAAFALAGLTIFHVSALPEGPKGSEAKSDFLATLATWIREPRMLVTLLFVVTYRAGDALMFAMNTPFLSSLGLGTTQRGVVQGVVGTLCSIGGALLGGVWISRRGLEKTLSPIAVMQACAIGLYVLIAAVHAPLAVVGVVVGVEQLLAGIGTAGLTVFILERSRGDYRASRFAVLTAIMTFATTGAGAVSGFIVEAIGYPSFFVVAFIAALPGVALSWMVPKGESQGAPRGLRSPG